MTDQLTPLVQTDQVPYRCAVMGGDILGRGLRCIFEPAVTGEFRPGSGERITVNVCAAHAHLVVNARPLAA